MMLTTLGLLDKMKENNKKKDTIRKSLLDKMKKNNKKKEIIRKIQTTIQCAKLLDNKDKLQSLLQQLKDIN